MTEVTIKASATYRVLIDDSILKISGKLIRETCAGKNAVIVCGDNVAKLYASEVGDSLNKAGYDVHLFVYPHGEKSKNAEVYLKLLNYLAENEITRNDVIVALGGGVTGDLAGFAAATYMRGMSYVQIPTTLLAMVDSSVGGKTAIDLDSGKNLVGAFWQPKIVICDYSTLLTLPEENYREGCAEVVKYGILRDGELLDLLENSKDNIEDIIKKCIEIKRDIVQEDEFDKGTRGLLNLGHTVAHAVEKLTEYKVSHGEAVSVGLAVILKSAAKSGDCSQELCDRVLSLLARLGLPVTTECSEEDILENIDHDKKRSGNEILLIIPLAVGKCEMRKMSLRDARNYLECGL